MASLTSAEREALSAAGRLRTLTPGEPLWRAGDRADTAVIVSSGVVKVHLADRDGRELILALCGPGDLLGEVTTVREGVRSADVTALDAVRAIVITVSRLRAVLAEHPGTSLALLDLALDRLRAADRRRLESATTESLPRVAARLVELAERFGDVGPDGSVVVALPLTQDVLAAWAGASREATARSLRTLRELGLIATARRRLTVRDLAGLRRHTPAP